MEYVEWWSSVLPVDTMTTALDNLRNLIGQVVRDVARDLIREEVARAIAAATTPGEYLSSGQAAEFAGVSTRTIRNWLADGRLVESGRAGHAIRIRRTDLENLLAKGRKPRDRVLTPEQLADRDSR